MNRTLMYQDPHTPAFIRAEVTNNLQSTEQSKESTQRQSHISWHRILRVALILATIACGLYMLSKLVTPQVVTVLSILIGFVVIRFIVRTILHITFTLLRYLIWIIVLAVILLCVL